jgi:hypothetical protein
VVNYFSGKVRRHSFLMVQLQSMVAEMRHGMIQGMVDTMAQPVTGN